MKELLEILALYIKDLYKRHDDEYTLFKHMLKHRQGFCFVNGYYDFTLEEWWNVDGRNDTELLLYIVCCISYLDLFKDKQKYFNILTQGFIQQLALFDIAEKIAKELKCEDSD